tara:strand:- start:1255 stop:2001 length:747 start_codon:yes stop_codon:yes gene_type:complete
VGHLTIAGSGESRIVDVRRHKDYRRLVRVAGHVTWKKDDLDESGPFWGLDEAFKTSFSPLQVSATSCNGWRGYSTGEDFRLFYALVMPSASAAKPSLIPDEASCWKQYGLDSADVAGRIVEAVVHAHGKWVEQRAERDRVQQANAVRDWAAEEYLSRAKAKCRFKARRAALVAELKEEVRQAVEASREELEKELEAHIWNEGTGAKFDARAIKAGLVHAEKVAEARAGSVMRRGFPAIPGDTPVEEIR